MTGQWWVHTLILQGEITRLISWVFWVIFAICLHELAHGWAALWQGDQTPRRLNRMTLNPLVHMGGWSLLVFALIGIAWGVMPTDPRQYRWGRRGRIVVAAAGPAMNIALSIAALTLLAIWAAYGPSQSEWFDEVVIFLFVGGYLNLVLAVFNLLPIPPLDGAAILGGFSLRMQQTLENQQVQMFGMFAVLALLLLGVWGYLFAAARGVATLYVDLVQFILP